MDPVQNNLINHLPFQRDFTKKLLKASGIALLIKTELFLRLELIILHAALHGLRVLSIFVAFPVLLA